MHPRHLIWIFAVFLCHEKALIGSIGVQLLVFVCFSISIISCCRDLIVVSSLFSFDFFMFLEMLHWWVRNLSRGLNICLVYTKAELRARVVAKLNRFKSPSKGFYWPFQGGASAEVYFFCQGVSLHVYPGDFCFILDSRLANFLRKELSFCLSACSVLIMVPLL